MTGIRLQTVNDIAEASGPAVTGAGGSVGTGKGFRTVSEIAGAGGPAGTGAGGPVVAGTLMYTPHLRKRRATHGATLEDSTRSRKQSR